MTKSFQLLDRVTRNPWNILDEFERTVAEFYGAKYAVSVDCCTHAVELCLRLIKPDWVSCPSQTYISIPFTFEKLNLDWDFENYNWTNYYFIGNTPIIDAAVYWKQGGYIPNTFMCLSFQFQKHLSLAKGGMILTDDFYAYEELKKMSCDGRVRTSPWMSQDISTVGYHYYMTPEVAQLGIDKFEEAVKKEPRIWTQSDYPYLPKLPVFKNKNVRQS
ncbi:DegT/DnrJ/EryC1/StrS aminotransferase [uncultured Caudovirales phage]|uniref:DegT/DnrJ/EryC1/StrS aminotransferase n=1 Tax=uncultured Caudovirales phage TaxID=2100421 RepID=A0A6J5LK31_9CAUD|nr:DegT/DnrJ/EryC1/StrS aminotransferase [uncultured Caudovirales phage]